MRTILIQSENKSFLDKRGEWTPEASRAQRFPSTLNAIVHCLKNNIGEANVVIRIEGKRDVVIPIKEETHHPALHGGADR